MAKMDMQKFKTAHGAAMEGTAVRASLDRAPRYLDLDDQFVPAMLDEARIEPTSVNGVYVFTKKGWTALVQEVLRQEADSAIPPDGKHRVK